MGFGLHGEDMGTGSFGAFPANLGLTDTASSEPELWTYVYDFSDVFQS